MKRITLPLLLLVVPNLAAAQTTRISSYVASDDGVRGAPLMVGVAVGRESEYLGVRWNAAVDALPQMGGPGSLEEAPDGVLTTEVDAMLFPLAWAEGLAVTPYALAGAGMRLVRDAEGSGGGVWSYGAGFRAPLTGWLQVEGEARHRTPFTRVEAYAPSRSGWEIRAGLGLRFGRSAVAVPRSAAPAYPRPGGAPLGTALPAPATSGARSSMVSQLIDTGDDFLGTPYRWGGNTPQEGFDCSGFVRYVYARYGIDLPRVSRDQARVGIPLPLEPSAFLPGDLLAFSSGGGEVDHIAIYAGDGRILHSSASGEGVRYDDLLGPRGRWYREHMVAARRVIPEVTASIQ